MTREVKPKRLPVLRAHEDETLVDRDRLAATIAGLPEAGTVPQLNRVMTWQATRCDPVSNDLPNDIWRHVKTALHIGAHEVDSCNGKHQSEDQSTQPADAVPAGRTLCRANLSRDDLDHQILLLAADELGDPRPDRHGARVGVPDSRP